MEKEEKASGRSKSNAKRAQAGDRRSALGERFKGRKWQALIPAAAGISLLLLGYYLDAQVIRIIGMVILGIVLVLLC